MRARNVEEDRTIDEGQHIYATPYSFFRHLFTVRSFAIFFWGAAAVFIMNIFNAITYSRMPLGSPLPDCAADSWKEFGFLRANKKLMSHQPTDLYSFLIIFLTSVTGLIFFKYVNVRRFGICYAVCVHFRTILFTVTDLPPPCIGYPNCPCSYTLYEDVKKNYSNLQIAFKYTFGGGIWLNAVPQCGDLAMSGHTIFIWLLTFVFLNTMKGALEERPTILACIRIVFFTMLTIITAYIIFIRNHYTIDILLAVVYTVLVWYVYELGVIKLAVEPKQFVKTWFGRFMQWAEKDYDKMGVADEPDVEELIVDTSISQSDNEIGIIDNVNENENIQV